MLDFFLNQRTHCGNGAHQAAINIFIFLLNFYDLPAASQKSIFTMIFFFALSTQSKILMSCDAYIE